MNKFYLVSCVFAAFMNKSYGIICVFTVFSFIFSLYVRLEMRIISGLVERVRRVAAYIHL